MSDSRPETYKHIQTVQGIMLGIVGDLQARAHIHDQSKLVSPEVEAFDEYTPKLKNSTYGSDEYKSFLAVMKPALDHHYAANSHHPEHYRWKCAICPGYFSQADYDAAPQGPNDTGKRYCPRCCSNGMIYECDLEPAEHGILGMSLLDLIEMLADWKAATMRHADGDIRESIKINQKRFGYSDELKQILLNTLPALKTVA